MRAAVLNGLVAVAVYSVLTYALFDHSCSNIQKSRPVSVGTVDLSRSCRCYRKDWSELQVLKIDAPDARTMPSVVGAVDLVLTGPCLQNCSSQPQESASGKSTVLPMLDVVFVLLTVLLSLSTFLSVI